MSTLDDVEQKLLMVQEMRAVEMALDRCNRAIAVNPDTYVTCIAAQDAADSHRSIELQFSPDESKPIFEAASASLQIRHAKLKEALGL